MINRLIILCFSFVFVFSYNASAQTVKIDSLINELEIAKNKSEKLSITNNLALLLSRSYPDSAIKYSKMAKQLAKELGDSVEIANNYKNTGNIYYTLNELDSAIIEYHKALDIFILLNDTLGRSKIQHNLGALNLAKGDYTSSMEHYQKSLELKELLKDSAGLGSTYNNIGNLHYTLNELNLALHYYKKSLELRRNFNHNNGIAQSIANMGLVYISKEVYDTAIILLDKGVEMYKKNGDLQGVAHSYTSLGMVYKLMGEINKSSDYYQDALKLYKQIGNKRGVSQTYSQIAEIYNQKGKHDSALRYANKGLTVSEKYNTIVEKSDAYKQLSIAIEGRRNYKKAFDYYKKHVSLRDSLINLRKIKEIKIIEQKYQSENQKLEIAKLETENKLNKIKLEKLNNRQIISVIGIILAMGFILNLLINRHRLKSKNSTIQDQNKKISRQKVELERHRNHLEELVKERTKDLKKAKDRAEESDRLKSAFLTNMSHEIRTPMNAIMGFTELLNSTDPSEEERAEYRRFIESNSELLLRLMDDIIDIAKIESGQITVSKLPVDLKDIMRKIVPIFRKKRQQTDKEQLEIIDEVSVNNECRQVLADPIRVQQILTNLVDNALKFTEKGYVKISCCVEEVDDKLYIKVDVEDTGIGMNEEQQIIIFERFGKIEENTEKMFRGAGLGLTICKNLVELMGGEIWVTSEEGNGTTFSFRLPVYES